MRFGSDSEGPCLAEVGSQVRRKDPTMRRTVRRPFRGEWGSGSGSHANDGRFDEEWPTARPPPRPPPRPPMGAKLRGPTVGRWKWEVFDSDEDRSSGNLFASSSVVAKYQNMTASQIE